MRVLSVFLKNKNPYYLSLPKLNCNKIILKKLVCNEKSIEGITNCVLCMNDQPVHFLKSENSVFYINGIENNYSAQAIEPLSMVKFKLKVNYSGKEEKKYDNIRFQIHLSI